MDAALYTTLNRQSGLMREMGVVANNIANASTNGFRREGVVFSEFVAALDEDPSLSMAHASGRHVDLSQATLAMTGGAFDFAIQGEGFFLIETPQGERLTRAGSFTPSPEGELVTADGYRLLDAGGAPICSASRPFSFMKSSVYSSRLPMRRLHSSIAARYSLLRMASSTQRNSSFLRMARSSRLANASPVKGFSR